MILLLGAQFRSLFGELKFHKPCGAVNFCCCVSSVVSDSVRPHRQQPTRPHCPWDSPGKNTGVGCHFLLQRMEVKSEREVAQLCRTLSDPMDCSLPGSSAHGIFQARVLEWGAIAFSTLPCYSFPNLMYNSKPTHSGLHLTEFCMVMHSFLMINDSF